MLNVLKNFINSFNFKRKESNIEIEGDLSVQFKEINIDDEPQYIEQIKAMGFMAAPIIVKDEVSFSGFRPAELAKLV